MIPKLFNIKKIISFFFDVVEKPKNIVVLKKNNAVPFTPFCQFNKLNASESKIIFHQRL